jgi:starvation-inducible DNA-binding protein
MFQGYDMIGILPDVTKFHPATLFQPNSALDRDSRTAIIRILNSLTADEVILAMKTRCSYLHVYGPGFTQCRMIFDRQFVLINSISEEIKERVQVLGGFAISSFEEFLGLARLKEKPSVIPDMIELLADHQAIVRCLRDNARLCFQELDDPQTHTMLDRYIQLHEKMVGSLHSQIGHAILDKEHIE